MRTTTMLLVPLATLMMACESATDPLIIDPPSEPAGLAPQASVQSPHVFYMEQVSRGVTEIIGWCDEAAGVALASAPGTGTATHIGRFQIRQTNCLNLVTGAVTAGAGTMITANGDEIYFTYDGGAVAVAPPTLELHYVINGGTGRFGRAEGVGDHRVVRTTPSTWESTGGGWLSYAASDRSGS